MTCEEFRQIANTFSLEMPHAVGRALFRHMAQCPHCEEFVVQMAQKAPPFDPQQAAAYSAYGKAVAKELPDGR